MPEAPPPSSASQSAAERFKAQKDSHDTAESTEQELPRKEQWEREPEKFRPLSKDSMVDPDYLETSDGLFNWWRELSKYFGKNDMYYIEDGEWWSGHSGSTNLASSGVSRRLVLGSYGHEVANMQVLLNHIPGVTPVSTHGYAGEDTIWAIRHFNRWLHEIGEGQEREGDYLVDPSDLERTALPIKYFAEHGLEHIEYTEAGKRARAYIEEQKRAGVPIRKVSPSTSALILHGSEVE